MVALAILTTAAQSQTILETKPVSSATPTWQPEIQLQTTENAEIRRRIIPTGKEKRLEIIYHLDAEKLNRINATRNVQKIRKYPELFGPKKEFPPLVTIRAQGPGRINIHGEPATGDINLEIGSEREELEIYPIYKMTSLKNQKNKEEVVEIRWEDKYGERKMDARTLPWSNLNEVFLSENRLQDLAAVSWATGTAWQTREECPKMLRSLSQKNIEYEIPTAPGGWQQIRTLKEILVEKRANCLDMTIVIAGASARSGWLSKIYILGEHSIPTFGDPSEPLILETTALIKSAKNGKPRSIDLALEEGKKNLEKALEKGVIEIDVKRWKEIYRY